MDRGGCRAGGIWSPQSLRNPKPLNSAWFAIYRTGEDLLDLRNVLRHAKRFQHRCSLFSEPRRFLFVGLVDPTQGPRQVTGTSCLELHANREMTSHLSQSPAIG